MKIIRECQKDTLTYWAYQGTDINGRISYANPVTMTCRWDYANKQVFTEDGSPVFSKIELITQRQLAVKGLVREGRLVGQEHQADPRSLSNVYEILWVAKTPLLKTRSIFLYEACA